MAGLRRSPLRRFHFTGSELCGESEGGDAFINQYKVHKPPPSGAWADYLAHHHRSTTQGTLSRKMMLFCASPCGCHI